MHPVFTIGHSNHEFATFRALLTRHGIDAVADVRSIPYSRRYPQFAKRPLAEALDGASVGYLWLGDALGDLILAQTDGAATDDATASADLLDPELEEALVESLDVLEDLELVEGLELLEALELLDDPAIELIDEEES